jgi:NADH dehydrogenase
MAAAPKSRVVVMGGGFAGIAAVRALEDRHDVTLIDRKPSFEFLPNIHEIVSGLKRPGLVRLSLERVARHVGQTFVQDEVQEIDPRARRVITSSLEIPYDVLILAPGGTPRTSGVAGVETYGHYCWSAEHAEAIRRRLEVVAALPGRNHVTIVGGGFTGVEVLGEILRKHRRKGRLAVRLIESGRRLMGDWPKVLHKRVKKIAEDHDVELRLATRVARVDEDHITLTTGESLPSQLTIWTAGARAPELLHKAGFAASKSGWVAVDQTLAAREFPDVFLAGDAAELPRRVAKQGEEALRMGARAAKNAMRLLRGRPLKAFRRDQAPLLVTFGDLNAFVLLEDDTVLEGRALAAGRELVFQENMSMFDDLAGGRPVERMSRRMAKGERKLGWSRSLFPWNAVDQMLGVRVHPRP